MEKCDGVAPAKNRRERFFARSFGTSFAANVNGNVTEIDLYDEIGVWGVNSKEFRARLKDAGDVTLRINSPGGDVFDGLAMLSDLQDHKGKVRVEISGLAASAASLIAMGGHEIAMAENSMMMIHNAWTFVVGDRHDLADVAGRLTKIDDILARAYATRTKNGIKTVKQMLDDETWFTAKEAVAAGFADEVIKAADVQAKFDLSVFDNVPDALAWPEDVPDRTLRDAERALREVGWSRNSARKVFAREDVRRDAEVDLKELAAAISGARAAFNT